MYPMIGPSQHFPEGQLASALLDLWRRSGPERVRSQMVAMDRDRRERCPLLRELWARLHQQVGPRLLVDGIWLSRTHGGITRVWQQIQRCWALPGLLYAAAPVQTIAPSGADPLDWAAVEAQAQVNRQAIQDWSADVFLSSWITSTGGSAEHAACPELALVHDCIPERAEGASLEQRKLRTRWLLGADQHLAMSAATAQDLAQALGRPKEKLCWCHPCTAHLFVPQLGDADAGGTLRRRLNLPQSFVLLPASSAIGSYKNPELVLKALAVPSLQRHHLVLTGVAATAQAQRYEQAFQELAGRIHVRPVDDNDLRLLYRHALAVVVPSRVEGFGLPVIEALASDAMVISTDVRGLREAADGAVPLIDPEQHQQLVAWLKMLADPRSRRWLIEACRARRQKRLATTSPELVGLVLLALARQVAKP